MFRIHMLNLYEILPVDVSKRTWCGPIKACVLMKLNTVILISYSP